jgi:hypothetical protein
MKIKTGLLYVVAVFVTAVNPGVSTAQRAGFQIGIAQPATPFLPTQAPAIVTNGTFVSRFTGPVPTVVIIQNPVIAPSPVFIPGQVFTPNPAFGPNPFVVPAFPAQTSFFTQTEPPTQMVVPPHILVPGQTSINPAATVPVNAQPQSFFNNAPQPAVPDLRTGPVAGMSRVDVLRQFGQPTVTITTSTGETLYFNGGITVTLHNGQVTGPR